MFQSFLLLCCVSLFLSWSCALQRCSHNTAKVGRFRQRANEAGLLFLIPTTSHWSSCNTAVFASLCVSFRPRFDGNTDSTSNKRLFPREDAPTLAWKELCFTFCSLSVSVWFSDVKLPSHLERVAHMLQRGGNLLHCKNKTFYQVISFCL